MSLICPICQENLINSEAIDNYVNKCGHVYHSACILRWWDSAPESTCPECRQPCNMDTITKIFLTVDHSEVNADETDAAINTVGDLKTRNLLRQIKEHIDVQIYKQTKDINDKFRLQNTEFSTLLLNSNQRLTSNYNEKLSSAKTDLTKILSEEHKRLLSRLESEPRQSKQSTSYKISDSDDNPTDDKVPRNSSFCRSLANYWKSKSVSYFAFRIAILCLIVFAFVYLHVIWRAVESSKLTNEKTNNVSQQVAVLKQDFYKIANVVSHDIDNIKSDLKNMRELMKNSPNTKDVSNKLIEISRKGDELLLEQIQTDQRLNLKLEILHNGIKSLNTQIHSNNSNVLNVQSKVNQLEEQSQKLETQLKRLETILSEGRHLSPVDLIKQIEKEAELFEKKEEDSIWSQPSQLWRRITDAISVTSPGIRITAKVAFVFTCSFSASIFSVFII